jgi:AcrR family transcriptional regulator
VAVEASEPRQIAYVRESAAHVSELQRSRLLNAALVALEEVGYQEVSVARITARARVSRRTFYELFENCDACLLAMLESVIDSIAAELAPAGLEGLPWRARVRQGLFRILSFLDCDPVRARVCIVEAVHGGPAVLERRAAILARLAAVVDEGRREGGRGALCTPTTAEGVVGAAFTIVAGRLRRNESVPLTDLFGELLAIILLPYLGSAQTRRELSRPAPAELPPRASAERKPSASEDPLRGLPMRLTYRTVRVLEVLAEHPGLSNRQVGTLAGVDDQGQASKLLSRLDRLGLLSNDGPGHLRGEPNAWTLTVHGHEIAESILAHRPRLVPQEA